MKISKGGLPLMMGAYAKKYDIDLYMRGRFAYTDGATITIPRLDLNNKDALEMAYGYVAHECGHIRYSNFNLIHNIDSQSTLFNLFNSLEDTRIEYLQIRDWPGLAKTFNYLVEQLKNSGLKCIKKMSLSNNEGDCAPLTILFVNYCLRFKEVEQVAAQELYVKSKKLFEKYIGKKTVAILESIVAGVPKLPDSASVLKIAEKVVAFMQSVCLFQNLSFSEKISNRNNDIKQSSKHKASLDELANNFKSYGLDAKSVRELIADLKLTACGQNNLKGTDTENSNSAHELEFNRKISTSCNEELVLINSGVKEALNRLSSQVKEFEEFGLMTGGEAIPARNSDLLERVKSDQSLLYSIYNMLKGLKFDDVRYASSGDSVDVFKYASAMSTHSSLDKVFIRKTFRKKINTNVHLLVDSSGSMYARCQGSKKHRYEIANEVALTLALALEGQNNLSTEVTYFPGHKAEFETVARPYDYIANLANYFDQLPKGGTPLAQALMHAMYSFPEDPYARNIVFIITDGDPENPTAVQELMAEAEKLGIEIYAIRIGENINYCNIFKVNKVISDATELPSAVVDMFKEHIFNKSMMQY